jgi:hypothetical protein
LNACSVLSLAARAISIGHVQTAIRGLKWFVLALIVWMLVPTSPAIAMSPLPRPMPADGGTAIWYPQRHGGTELAAIIQLASGGYDVRVDPKRVYQNARLFGTMRDGSPIAVQYIEVRAGLAKEHASNGVGFRNDFSIREYPVLETYVEDRSSAVEVWTNGNGGYLFVITHKGVRP